MITIPMDEHRMVPDTIQVPEVGDVVEFITNDGEYIRTVVTLVHMSSNPCLQCAFRQGYGTRCPLKTRAETGYPTALCIQIRGKQPEHPIFKPVEDLI